MKKVLNKNRFNEVAKNIMIGSIMGSSPFVMGFGTIFIGRTIDEAIGAPPFASISCTLKEPMLP